MFLTDRDAPPPLIEEAIYAFRLGRLPQAIEVAAEILTSSPDARLAIDVSARASEQLQDWPAAIRHWKRLAVLDPDRTGPFFHLTTALIEQDEVEQALRVIDYLLLKEPDSAVLLRLKLRALLRLGKAERTAAFAAELGRREWGAG